MNSINLCFSAAGVQGEGGGGAVSLQLCNNVTLDW